MMGSEQQLQRLIDKEAARANTHGVLLRVQSGDRRIDFRGGAGGAKPEARIFMRQHQQDVYGHLGDAVRG